VTTRVLVERGNKKVFATAVDWPGWSRGAKTGDEALARLIEYGPRYKRSVGTAAAALELPRSITDLDVVLDTKGDANVDYGVPHTIVELDREMVSDAGLEREIGLLEAAWNAFEAAAAKAAGKTLTSGPRGGGRSVAQMVGHVHEADRAYIGALGAKAPPGSDGRSATTRAFVDAVHAKIRGELPERGPRGGERWPARYAIRRSAWHALDHAWEIEDRS